MANVDRSAKEVYNKLQNRSDKASIEELRSLIEDNFPTEELAEKAHSHIAKDLEVSAMEVTEDWFLDALTLEYDGPEVHEMIEDFTEDVYDEAEGRV